MPNVNTPPKIVDATVQISWSPDGTTTTGAYWGYTTVASVAYMYAAYAEMTTALIATPPAVHPIGEEITRAAFDLSDLLDHLYQMPYTGSDAKVLAGLRDMNTKLAVANLADRMYTSSEPNLSQVATLLRAQVAGIIEDLRTGLIIWYAPYGDAVPRARAPVYDTAAGAIGFPNPAEEMANAANAPLFQIGRSPFHRDIT